GAPLRPSRVYACFLRRRTMTPSRLTASTAATRRITVTVSITPSFSGGLIRLLEQALQITGNQNHRRPQEHDEHTGEDEQHQRKNQLNGGLRRQLLGLLPPFLSNTVSKHTQRANQRRAEAVRLRQHVYEALHRLHPGAVSHA